MKASSVVLEQSERWWLGLWKYVEPEMKLKMAAESKQGFWSRLTSQERETLSQLIDLNEQDNPRSKQYIGQYVPRSPYGALLIQMFAEHKYNLTLANLSVSLICHGQEIALASVTQFLLSLETRPAASAFKLSARAENFLLEGLGADNELVPLIQADSLSSGKD